MPNRKSASAVPSFTRRSLLAGSAVAGLSMLAAPPFLKAKEAGSVPAAPAGAGTDNSAVAGPETAPEGWTPASPREEIRPRFAVEPTGGPGGKPALLISADSREGLDGCWKRTFLVS